MYSSTLLILREDEVKILFYYHRVITVVIERLKRSPTTFQWCPNIINPEIFLDFFGILLGFTLLKVSLMSFASAFFLVQTI
jgi:hypothetical protein